MARSASRDERCTLPGCESGNTDLELKDANIRGGGTYHTHPKEGWRGKNLRINTSDLPHEHSFQNSNERLGQTTLQTPRGSQEGFRPDRSTRRQISRFISALLDVERNQGTICLTFLNFENNFDTISLPALFLLLRKFGMNENDVQALESYYELAHVGDPYQWRKICQDPAASWSQARLSPLTYIRGSCSECDAQMTRFQRRRPVTR